MYGMIDLLLDRTFIATDLIWSSVHPTRKRLKEFINFIAWIHKVLQEVVELPVPLFFVTKFLQYNICKPAKKRMEAAFARRSTGRKFSKRNRVPANRRLKRH